MTQHDKLLALAAASGLVLGLAACDDKPADGAKGADDKASAADDKKGDANCCVGKNDCKGKGGCKTDDHACAGKNDCKGKGGCKHREC